MDLGNSRHEDNHEQNNQERCGKQKSNERVALHVPCDYEPSGTPLKALCRGIAEDNDQREIKRENESPKQDQRGLATKRRRRESLFVSLCLR